LNGLRLEVASTFDITDHLDEACIGQAADGARADTHLARDFSYPQ
jgi:hypothetical protein